MLRQHRSFIRIPWKASRSLVPLVHPTSNRVYLPNAFRGFSPITTMASTPTVHQIAQKGFGAGTNELYDRCVCAFLKGPH